MKKSLKTTILLMQIDQVWEPVRTVNWLYYICFLLIFLFISSGEIIPVSSHSVALRLASPWKTQLLPFQFCHLSTVISACTLDFLSFLRNMNTAVSFLGLEKFMQIYFKCKVASATVLWAFPSCPSMITHADVVWTRMLLQGHDMHGRITAGNCHKILLLSSCEL